MIIVLTSLGLTTNDLNSTTRNQSSFEHKRGDIDFRTVRDTTGTGVSSTYYGNHTMSTPRPEPAYVDHSESLSEGPEYKNSSRSHSFKRDIT